MIFYHVSSYVNKGDHLTRESKKKYETCILISQIQINDHDDYIKLLTKMENDGIKEKTGRTHYKWSCEAIFETVRATLDKNLPSRIWGIFVTKSIDEAIKFRNNHRAKESHIFQVDIPEDSVYEFDMNLFTAAEKKLSVDPSEENYKKAVELAHRYWKRIIADASSLECLTEAEVEVGDEVV